MEHVASVRTAPYATVGRRSTTHPQDRVLGVAQPGTLLGCEALLTPIMQSLRTAKRLRPVFSVSGVPRWGLPRKVLIDAARATELEGVAVAAATIL